MHPEARRGARAMLPILLGVTPIAVVTGVAAVQAGLTRTEAMCSSVVMYAAAAQLVVYDLMRQHADLAVAFAASCVLNLRFLMYSAGLAPHLQGQGRLSRLLGAYALTDQAFGLTMVERQNNPEGMTSAYYLGAAACMWLAYQAAAAVGVFLGTGLPPELSMDFALPLTFSALLAPLLSRPELRVAALASAAVALALRGLPNNAGFFAAALTGIAAGAAYQRRASRRARPAGCAEGGSDA